MNDVKNTRGDALFEPPSALMEASSAVSWGAILAGGIGSAAFALILLMLGTGLGLSAISPWAPPSATATRFGFAAIAWICVTQILTSGLGGYLSGRLRRRWTAPSDETYFRDTAHGFLSWAVATVFTAGLLTWAVTGIVRSSVHVAAEGAQSGITAMSIERGNADTAMNSWPFGYFVDSLFRRQTAPATMLGTPDLGIAMQEEATRIFLNSLAAHDPLSADDSRYVAQLVAQRTGLSQSAAQARVNTTYTRLQQKLTELEASAKAKAEKARKATIYASLWLFVSLLLGAFSASLMATVGGRQRDF